MMEYCFSSSNLAFDQFHWNEKEVIIHKSNIPLCVCLSVTKHSHKTRNASAPNRVLPPFRQDKENNRTFCRYIASDFLYG